MSTPAPPSLPDDSLSGWRRVESTTDQLFDVGPVSVTATTVVYEDDRLRERVRESTDIDDQWRFFFAGRLAVSPPTPQSSALHRLVADRASSGFRERLRDSGFESPTERDRRTIRIDDTDASLRAYDATCRLGEVRLSVVGWLAVWPDGNEFILAGGAYPTAVVETGVGGADDDAPGVAAEDLSALLDPNTFREELFSLMRAVR